MHRELIKLRIDNQLKIQKSVELSANFSKLIKNFIVFNHFLKSVIHIAYAMIKYLNTQKIKYIFSLTFWI